jgi:hypothetical protein
MPVGRIGSISIDCDDPAALARFWADITGGEVAFSSDDFVAVKMPGGQWLSTVRVPGYRAPTWPEGETPKQMHLDVGVDDLDVAEQAALAAGAVKADHQASPERYRVLLDPAGHPFCITSLIPD